MKSTHLHGAQIPEHFENMIPGVVGRLVLFATIAFISVYFVFMMGMPIGIGTPCLLSEMATF